ncbi:YadA-like family protein [Neisseria animalis]|uniref:YadA-like family protein n=1 Tax=Neisseria animalis TaxID=492 RepID=UPI0020123535|nr:YadA-like family protein [Neisseria animalis]
MSYYDQVEINGVEYEGWAGLGRNFEGAQPISVVSVGDVGAERRIQNLAAGLIAKDSTDAVNGSQLFSLAAKVKNGYTHVNDGTQEQYDDWFSVTQADIDAKQAEVNAATNMEVRAELQEELNNLKEKFARIQEKQANNAGLYHQIGGATGTYSMTMGVNASATADNAISLGHNAKATEANSVALGAGSTTVAATPTSSATIGDVTYSGFAGKTPAGVVSVGDVGAERQIQNVAAGQITATSTDAINGSQLYQVIDKTNQDIKAAKTEVTGEGLAQVTTSTGDNGQTIYNVNVPKAGDATFTAGQVNVEGGDTTVFTADQVVNAINNSGWNVTAAENGTNELVQPGETVTFAAGKNMTLVQEGQTFTYATKDDVNFNSVQFGDTGPKITADGGNLKVEGPNGDSVNITNVKAGENDTDAVNVKQLKDTVAESKETVVSTDKSVDIKTGTNANGAAEFDLSVKTDNKTLEKDSETGELKVKTIDLTVNGGKVADAGDTTSLITADEVAKTINESGWYVTSEGGSSELVQPGETVTFAAGKNMTLVQDGQTFTYATKDDVNFNSVQFGDTTGPVISSNTDGAIHLGEGSTTGGPVQIVNLKSGLENPDGSTFSIADAAGDQLNNAVNVGDLKTTVKEVSADAYGLKDENGNEFKQDLGTTAQIKGDGNINTNVVTNEDGSKALEVSLSHKVDIGPGKDGQDGSLGVNGADGDSVTITPEAIVFHGKNGEDGQSGSLKMVDGLPGLDGANGLDGRDGESELRLEFDGKQLATLEDGLRFTGNNDVENKHKLNSLVTIEGEGVDKATSDSFLSAAGNINVVADGGSTLTIQLNKDVNLGETGSLSFGDTKIDVTEKGNINLGKGKDGTEAVQIVNLDSGLKDEAGNTFTITDAPDTINNNAVNVGDLKLAVNEAVGKSGFTLKADKAKDGKNTTDASLADGEFIGAGETVTLIAGKNMIVEHTADGNITYSTDDRVTFGGLGKDGKDGKDGFIGINGKDGKDGISLTPDAITFHGEDGRDGVDGITIVPDAITFRGLDGVNGKDGVDGKDASLTMGKGEKGLDGNDGVDGKSKTRIIYTKPNGDEEEVATLNDGLYFTGNNSDTLNPHKLNSTVHIVGDKAKGDTSSFVSAQGNINVVADGGSTLTIQLNKDVNLGETGSLSFGDTKIDVTPKGNIHLGRGDQGAPVQIVNLESGLKDEDGNQVALINASGDMLNNAVNVGDLQNALAGVTKSEVRAGTNVANVTHTVGANGESIYTVNAEGTNVKAGSDNVTVTHGKRDGDNDVTYTVDIAKDLVLDSVTTGNATLDGKGLTIAGGPSLTVDGLDAGGKTITGVKAGVNPDDAVNMSQLNAAVKGAKSTVSSADDSVTVRETVHPATGVTNYDLSVKVDGTTITNEPGKGLTVHTTEFEHANGQVQVPAGNEGKLATADDIAKAINNSGFTLTAQGENGSVVKPGSTVDMKNTDGNIAISKSADDNAVVYNLAKDIKVDTLQVGGENGPKIGADGEGNIAIGNANGEPVRITNVAPGVNGTDAVNVNQLKHGLGQLKNDIDNVGKKANAGVAGAIAQGSIPQVTRPGATGLGIGGGYYGGESAMAIGLSSMSDGGNWIIKGNFSANSNGNVGIGAGALYQW